MKDIYLKSRYGDNYKLIHIKENLYKADFGNEYIRFGENEGICNFVDPSGGPLLHIGDVLPNGSVIISIKIDDGIYLTLEDEKTD